MLEQREDKDYVRVPNGDPEQCEAIRQGMGTQCNFKRVEGGRTCLMHGGHNVENIKRAKSLNSYRLGKYQQRHREFVESTGLRSVDEEIAILRMVLEEIFAKCNDGVDLLLYSEKISNLIHDITKCVQVADRLATKSGMLIGRAEAIVIGQKVIDIVARHIKSESDLLTIAEEISDAFLPQMVEHSAIGHVNNFQN